MTAPAPPLPLAGRVALVTGGSRGVGAAVATRLGADGAAVAVNYRAGREAAEEVVRRIVDAGGRAAAFGASVADPDDRTRLLAELDDWAGPVDLIVSNAGTASRGRPIAATDDTEYRALLDVHTLGPLALVRALLPGLRAAGRGDVVMISSALTDSAPAFGAPYTMAKAAMEAAMRTLAREERRHGIHVNVVAPGLVATDMGEKLVAATTGGRDIAAVAGNFPFGRVCTPDDVAQAVAFLVGDGGGYVTGQRILLDGGGPDVSVTHGSI